MTVFPPHWPWTSFWVRDQYAQLPDADLPNLPAELNPYLPWWWRFSSATIIGALCIFTGSAVAMNLALIDWLWGDGALLLALIFEGLAAGVAIGIWSETGGA